MPQLLNTIIHYRGDRLFNGAVSISWFGTDEKKAKAASEAFVFHGPQYHGFKQEDVGTTHGHRLTDTASLARTVARICYGSEDQPFTLAIAGYGTGKSHLGLTLATLLSDPESKTSANILSSIDGTDSEIGSDIRVLLQASNQPCLVVTLNGMQKFDLAAEISKQIIRILKSRDIDTKPLDDLRPRFAQAANLINLSNDAVIKELQESCEGSSIQDLLSGLKQQDERTYSRVHAFFEARGMSIHTLAGESVKDVIDVAAHEYCGKEKPFRCLLIIFDEFGKYTEFATIQSHIAGSGALQDLFEAIQSNTGNAYFLGFIQFELNAYVQRIAPEYKNEILRYVTRYQQANRVYLSINLETLIASLLEKRQTKLVDAWFDNKEARKDSKVLMENLMHRYPQAENYRLWTDPDQFHSVICKGCWPLSPTATWLLFYLTAAGKHLQERSALALLGEVIQRYTDTAVPEGGGWTLSPVDLWSDMLQLELISSEVAGQQGSITHAYASVLARHEARLAPDLRRLLCAVVLASKLGLRVISKNEAIRAIADLAGLSDDDATDGIRLLQEEYNVLEWDDSFKAFDILGDAVPRSQFLAFVRQRVESIYDEAGKTKLFASKAREWCELLHDQECDFAEEHKITTKEWRYQSETSNHEYLQQQIKFAADRWANAYSVDEPRGTIIYTYIEQSRNPDAVLEDAKSFLKAVGCNVGYEALPILVVILFDDMGALGQALAEYAVLEEGVSAVDNAKFGNLIKAHKEKARQIMRDQISDMLKERRYATGLQGDLEAQRINRAGTELFSKIYTSPLTFPFDGFSTSKGNAADTCQELTRELLLGKLDYEAVTAKPAKAKNRALMVLKNTWEIFTRTGKVSRRPAYSVARDITERWDEALVNDEKRIPVADFLRQLIRPPYGANIASAGLLLGVCVAPRTERLIAVKDGQQFAISQLVQDVFFKGKFIDLSALHGFDIILHGEASSEWETLLDEWERAESHEARKSCYSRSQQLKNRIPLPPALIYKADHLRDQAMGSNDEINKKEKAIDDALSKIEKGEQREDISLLSWGAADLKSLLDKMEMEKPLWTESEIGQIQPHYERSRQAIINYFQGWLVRQKPQTDTPLHVADFKHKMLDVIGKSLKKLGLEDESEKLQTHTLYVIRNAEVLAEFTQLQRDIKSLEDACGFSLRVVRMANLRGLRNKGNEYVQKILDIQKKKVQILEIETTEKMLLGCLKKLKETEDMIRKKATDLWQSKIQTEKDVDLLLGEVESLVIVYDNLPPDIEDLRLMQRALALYHRSYLRLSGEDMSWGKFIAISSEVKNECVDALAEEEIPWPPETVIDMFINNEKTKREAASASWIWSLEEQAKSLVSMSAVAANRLYNQASNPPPIVSDSDLKIAASVVKRVEERLVSLNIEWLLEKFKELSQAAKKDFLQRVQKLGAGS